MVKLGVGRGVLRQGRAAVAPGEGRAGRGGVHPVVGVHHRQVRLRLVGSRGGQGEAGLVAR